MDFVLIALSWLQMCGIAPAKSALAQDCARVRCLGRFVVPGMHQADVIRLLGVPLCSESHGPPGNFVVVYSYPFSGLHVTFKHDGRVAAVRR